MSRLNHGPSRKDLPSVPPLPPRPRVKKSALSMPLPPVPNLSGPARHTIAGTAPPSIKFEASDSEGGPARHTIAGTAPPSIKFGANDSEGGQAERNEHSSYYYSASRNVDRKERLVRDTRSPSKSDDSVFERVTEIYQDAKKMNYDKCKWFWGTISRREAEQRLLSEGKVGNFIVRISASGHYVLTHWRRDGTLHHHRILKQGIIFYFEKSIAQIEGESLVDLLDMYMRNVRGTKGKLMNPFGEVLYDIYDSPWSAPDLDMNLLAEQLALRKKSLIEKAGQRPGQYTPIDLKASTAIQEGDQTAITSPTATHGEQQKYFKALNELMTDIKNTILLHYIKLYFIGTSGLGKSTTRKRLTGLIRNLASLPERERKCCSTYLAECTQVMAIMDDSQSKLVFRVSDNLDKETQLLFAYLYKNKETEHIFPALPDLPICPEEGSDPVTSTNELASSAEVPPAVRECVESKTINLVTTVNVDEVITRLRSIVGSGDYEEKLEGKVLLNLVDMGGQPGFLEMLPFLSKGPGIFLVFFPLDKDFDEPCQVSYEREDDKITPYKAIYTIREMLSQILSAIKHHISLDSAIDEQYLKNLGHLASAKPVATLVGTFKDKLKTKVKTEVLLKKLSVRFPRVSESDIMKVITYALARADNSSKKQNFDNFVAKSNSDMQSFVIQLLWSESFMMEVDDCLERALEVKNNALSSITRHFEDLLLPPADNKLFIALDNFAGMEADIDPLRETLQDMFTSFFANVQLRIRSSQLLLGVVLRKEYDIVSMDDCIQIGRALSMGEEEVRFSVWYLDRWVGALIYHPEIEDEDDWFKKNIICSPQVIFDSISSLIVKSLLALHCPKGSSRSSIRFMPSERKNWIEKGQFSLDTVKRCLSKENEEKVKQGKLIPVEKLIKFLEHSNLLSLITSKKKQGRRDTEEIMCFIPAILECASPEELTKSPATGINAPFPIKILFETGYMPLGMFCAVISRLVSRGSEGMLGMKWELVESGVKRNLVSFSVDSAKHTVTLRAHADCYEVYAIRQDRSVSLHDLCSYVLSTVLYMIKEINGQARPIIAFDCQCGQHQSTSSNKLCRLSPGVSTCFTCEHGRVHLKAAQESWFAKRVKLGEVVSLKALPYAEVDTSLSFKWVKNGSYEGNEAELTVKGTQDNCTGYYSCQVLRNGQKFLSVYHCLRSAHGGNVIVGASTTRPQDCLSVDEHLKAVRTIMWDLKTQWYDLGVELNVTLSTLKEINYEKKNAKDRFTVMLECWLSRSSPAPTWTALAEALRSRVINRADIARNIEAHSIGSVSATSGRDQSQLNVDKHLKIVRNTTWELKASWFDLGIELGVTLTKLQEIKNDHPDTTSCFTALLVHWLTQSSPPPTWTILLEAIRSRPLGRNDIADQIETELKKGQ